MPTIRIYEIAVNSVHGDEHVMANYLPVLLDSTGYQWLLSFPDNHFDSWGAIKKTFVDNFMATCDQPGTKYDLERIRNKKGEPLRAYIQRFSDTRLKIPSVFHDEACSAFIKGLRYHDTLRSKLLRKRPKTISELLAIAKSYADADDAEKIIKEYVGGTSHPEPSRRDDKRDDKRTDCRDDRGRDDRDRDDRGRSSNRDGHRDNRNDDYDQRDDSRDRRNDNCGRDRRQCGGYKG